MGRKPSKLILEFFERGPKLEDASNRYQQTCRSCGEKFPKGRLDSLTTHLVKRCPALTDRDRQRAILQFHDLPDLPATSPTAAQHGGQPGSQMNALPFAAPKEGMSALETLAEVSRQHLDLSGKRVSTPGADNEERRGSMRTEGLQNGGQVFEDFLVQDEKPAFEESAGADAGSEYYQYEDYIFPPAYSFAAPHATETSSGPHSSLYQYETLAQGIQHGLSHATSAPSPQSLASTAPLAAHPSLVMAASAAEELRAAMPNANFGMEQDQTLSNGQLFQQQGRASQSWPQAIDPLLQDSGKEQVEMQDGTSDGNGNPRYSQPLGNMNGQQTTHFTADYSMNQKPSKPKVRGRFSDSRRKEVQEVRKRGACIRCRMLKKPCSEGSPCSTCVNVESARLWKSPCIRTRIADEFNLYSAGLHVVLAFHTISQAKSLVRFEQARGRIEATHFPDSSVYMTLTPLKGRKPVNAAIDPALLSHGFNLSLDGIQEIEMIDTEFDDVGTKLELYIKRLAPFLYESETSPFMKATLTQAHEMSEANKEGLLGKALELWIATRMLVDPELIVQLFFNEDLVPVKEPVLIDGLEAAAAAPSRVHIEPRSRPDSYNLMVAQLLGATEKRAATLSKFVMNDLERRLVQRQQANPFETFLVAVILLACVERMCWLFKSWESPQSQGQQQQAERAPDVPAADESMKHELEALAQANAASDPAPSMAAPPEQEHQHQQQPQSQPLSSIPPTDDPQQQQPQQQPQEPPQPQPHQPPPHPPSPTRWPLDKPPSHYIAQGPRFTDILHMLLKMRQVPPKTTTEPITNIIVPIDSLTNNLTTNAKVDAKSEELSREWFGRIRVTEGEVRAWRGREGTGGEGWLVARILVG